MYSGVFLLISGLVWSGECLPLNHRQTLPVENYGAAAGKAAEIAWGANATHVEVQLTFPTGGWVAMGLSPNGGMDQSDVLFGYVDAKTHEVVVQDRWLTADMATYQVNLEMDKQQDWQPVSGSKNASYTVLRAVRRLKTCDEKDRPFTNAAGPVIYSYSFTQPTSRTAAVRKHDVRGSVSINFLQSKEEDRSKMLKDVNKVLEFRMDNVHVSSEASTQYWCTLTQMPEFDKKYQSIAHEPLINQDNLPHIHHMLAYTCDDIPEEQMNEKTFLCGPEDGSFVMSYCKNLLAGWAMGAAPIAYQPANVGQPFTPEMSGKYVVVQMHYNNPDHADFNDDSGLRMMLTDKMRTYDSASLMIGALELDFAFTLPPEQKVFQLQAQCSDQCTSAALPKDGIKVFGSVIHMHTRGVSGVVRHFRGQKELPPLDMDRAYDFNLQAGREIDPPRVILPGDRLVLQCNYTTANDTEPVFGGEGSMEEMCLAFLEYYPKTAMHTCGASYPVMKYLTNGLMMDRNALTSIGASVSSQARQAMSGGANTNMMMKQEMMSELKGPVSDFINEIYWTPEKAKPLQDFYFARNNYIGVCVMDDGVKRVDNDNPPPIRPYVLPPLNAGCP
ncbi:DBH-like monooxygenase protein 1 [Paramacrobiotus metropolitanus]|uniref:DBH-like monooxygenase protein 1 n=1 Tax=Paramacrobiotus metropolitanus TaxID=2943436 RepID=UPI0024456C43|nr:DBH-like monooxygenase protein 1 [Paramacrobiotus metropolitanus]